jgi:ATP adenylyltransferase
MERLWSPWRMEYLTRDERVEGCIFCHKMAACEDRQNLILYRGKYTAILMNLYPYNSGHLMVIPYRHVSSIEALESETLGEVMALLNRCITILRRTMHPQGFNVGINIGKAAGAGIAEHVHVHVVPRWEGDTNFMQVCAETRVLPELLTDTYDKLAAALGELGTSEE